MSNLLSQPPTTAPLWSIGFRPFFLAAALYAVVLMVLWIAGLSGHLTLPLADLLNWHRHEMIFGFGSAVIAGFLLTSVANWTSKPPYSGRVLQGLFALWCAGRLVPWLSLGEWGGLIQIAFLPLLAVLLGRMMWPQGLRRHYPVLVILLLLSVTEWGVLYGWPWSAAESARLAVWIIAALMSLIIGRVLPFFMQRGLGLPAAALPANTPLAERVRLLSALAVVMATAYAGLNPAFSVGITSLFACAVNAWNLVRLHRIALWRVPLLWSLYLSYGWLVLAYGLWAAWGFGWIGSASLALHVLTVGAMASMMLAMMVRVSLGHTGRALQPSPMAVFALGSMQVAALLRLLAALGWSFGLHGAALFWCLAFAGFVIGCGRYLYLPRADA